MQAPALVRVRIHRRASERVSSAPRRTAPHRAAPHARTHLVHEGGVGVTQRGIALRSTRDLRVDGRRGQVGCAGHRHFAVGSRRGEAVGSCTCARRRQRVAGCARCQRVRCMAGSAAGLRTLVLAPREGALEGVVSRAARTHTAGDCAIARERSAAQRVLRAGLRREEGRCAG